MLAGSKDPTNSIKPNYNQEQHKNLKTRQET